MLECDVLNIDQKHAAPMEVGVILCAFSTPCTAGLISFTFVVIFSAFFCFWHSKITKMAFIILLRELGLTGAVFGILLRETVINEHNTRSIRTRCDAEVLKAGKELVGLKVNE